MSEKIPRLKKWGQNFLQDRHYLEEIASLGELTPQDRVLEIGPGDGRLTELLLRSGAEVIAVEIDPRWAEFLRERFAANLRFNLLNRDFLRLTREENQLIFDRPAVKVVANLPYYISTPILANLLLARDSLGLAIVLLQKEVGERLAASPGTRAAGALTLYLQYYATIEIIKTIPAAAFSPRPQVDSVIIRLRPRPTPAVKVYEESLFFSLIKAAFAQRRKTLVNSLGSLVHPKVTRATIEAGLLDLGLTPKVRGENLTLEEFAALCNFLVS